MRKFKNIILGILAFLFLAFEADGNPSLSPQVERYAGDTAGWPSHFTINPSKRGDKYGAVDSKGKILIPFEFDYVSGERYPNGCYFVEKNNSNGKALGGLYKPEIGLIFPCIYETIYYTDNPNLYRVKKDSKWGVLNGKGEVVIPIIYDRVIIDDNDIRIVHHEPGYWPEYGLFDLKGNLMLDYKKINFMILGEYNEGFCLFTDRKGEGIVDNKGNKRYLPDKYKISRSWGFDSNDSKVSEGLFAVYDMERERWGYMSTDIQLIIPCKYSTKYMIDCPPNFKNGRVKTTKEGIPVVIDSSGNEIF